MFFFSARECKPGLVYKDSLSSCVTSCDNVFRKDRDNCQHEAGCYCPEGKVWDNEYNCVPIRDCKCKHNDQYYGYGDKTKMDCKTW